MHDSPSSPTFGAGARPAVASVSNLKCPLCDRPHLSFAFAPSSGLPEITGVAQGGGALLSGGESVKWAPLRERVHSVSVRLKGIPLDLVADPCLLRAAEAVETSPTEVSLWVARAHGSITDPPVCPHAVLVDGRVCTYLAVADEDGTIELFNLADLALPLSRPEMRAPLPIGTSLFEARPQESALSLRELMSLTEWTPADCETFPEPRPWAHLILVSHVWPTLSSPGSAADLERIKQRVRDHIDWQLEQNRRQANPRVKAKTPDEFGVWIDYMIVPNNPAHEGCRRCEERKRELIARINALLTIATVLPMDPHHADRGWILQEMSGNTHTTEDPEATSFKHRHRARLMAGGAKFGIPADGKLLRSFELVRLGQMPRTWPAVNLELLKRLEQAGMIDEGSPESSRILLGLARTFDEPCHDAKRLMVELSQRVATTLPGGPRVAEKAIDVSEIVRAVERQGDAMRELARRIHPEDTSELQKIDLEERIALTRRLQIRQFVGVAMGLRSEWLRDAALGPWAWLTEVSNALAGAKFMARLRLVPSPSSGGEVDFLEHPYRDVTSSGGAVRESITTERPTKEVRTREGRVRFSTVASSTILEEKELDPAARYARALDVAAHGVPVAALRLAYALVKPDGAKGTPNSGSQAG